MPRQALRLARGECSACGTVHSFGDLPSAYVQLLGLYLGDGYLAPHRRGVFRLRISLDARYPGIVSQCEDAMRQVLPRSRVNRVGRGTWYEVYSYSKGWPCLFLSMAPARSTSDRSP